MQQAKNIHQEPSEADLDSYEDGFENGYDIFRDGLPLVYKVEGDTIWLSAGDAEESHRDGTNAYWYALGVIRGFEQARRVS